MEWWHERAAIREHDGVMSRQQAEFAAAKDFQRTFGRIPDCVQDAVRQGRTETQTGLF